jgi:preprotein translocase subunit SecD
MRPSRYLFALAAIFVLLYGGLLIFGSGSISERMKPQLGLDLIGGSTMTLNASTLDGNPPTASSLEQARDTIEKRVNGSGVTEAEVVIEGDSNIIISVPGQNNPAIRNVGTPAQLRFRKVINSTSGSGVSAQTTPTPTPGATGTASPAPTRTTAPPTTTRPATTTPPATTTAPGPSGSASPSPGGFDYAKEQEKVLRKLGPAVVQVAQNITDPSTVLADTALLRQLDPFGKLSGDEVRVLPLQLQFNVPQVSCDLLNRRPPGSVENIDEPAVACDNKNVKYLLDKAKTEGTDVSSASANLDQTKGWVVNVTFNGDGAKKWQALTQEAFNNEGSGCIVTQPKDTGTGQVCQVAVVLDNEVVSAPAVQAVQNDDSQISGSFNKTSATQLSNQIKFGALPITFIPGEIQDISATLGADYLRAGLLAAGIGMLLVVAYAFFYYRLLGSVIFLSLVLSAALTFGMLVALGHGIGFTLTLAGIAGFIVSLGVAADSFVIYFERLKDEIREGRSPRSAIPRAWVRARRTIITANAVTILAALVLYLIGVGQVRGFAFALGLATLLDLIIVFLFRHPIMTLLAQTPAFLSPRVSGLGRVLHHATKDAPSSRTSRPKEA